MPKNLLKREMLKQCNDVREPFVKRQDVFIGGFHEVTLEAVHHSMCHFVRDDVVGEAREYILTRKVLSWVISVSAEISK